VRAQPVEPLHPACGHRPQSGELLGLGVGAVELEVGPHLVLDELARVREEVVNTRNLTIKTENALKNLATEVKTVARRQEGHDKKALLNNVGTYFLFVVVSAGGLWLTFQARLEKSKADHALFAKKETQLQHEVDELRAELGRWQQVERRSPAPHASVLV
jgi:hypothetical protein